MESKQESTQYQEIVNQLKYFYPADWITYDSVESDIITGKLLHNKEDFLPYLQTALLDEKFVELRFDDNEHPHFTKIIDWPETNGSSSGNEATVQSGKPLPPAAYFHDMTHITSLPLEPGIGNFHIRNSSKVIMRFFTKAFAVDFCTTFLSRDKDEDIPVLHFNFPILARLLYGVREYRAKVINELDLKVIVTGKRKQPDMICPVLNISVSGLAFDLQKHEAPHLFFDELRNLTILHDDVPVLKIDAKVRHVTRIRKRTSIAFMSGVQFDIISRSVASKVENLVAMVQRAHLQELSGLARETGYKLIT